LFDEDGFFYTGRLKKNVKSKTNQEIIVFGKKNQFFFRFDIKKIEILIVFKNIENFEEIGEKKSNISKANQIFFEEI